MNKYEERVRQRAEEMARAWEKEYIKHKDPEHYEQLIIEHMPAARLAVQWEAEAYTSGYSLGRDMKNDPYSRARLATMLKSLGLIPSPNQPKQ
ncbi:hypothetical protein EGT74_24455 [Chitinophaga lutea]|uniref:Uncharacterized protein n=1 Tax=Chitinophaga lutea TaxID=2488634 RepID=A0A3N4PG96_9BACT|nr:hypothetical protein [Chitinophaga lutea]RPE05539.1 hypothetical protein EGT74_24455 [Chitinophaga lutea]